MSAWIPAIAITIRLPHHDLHGLVTDFDENHAAGWECRADSGTAVIADGCTKKNAIRAIDADIRSVIRAVYYYSTTL